MTSIHRTIKICAILLLSVSIARPFSVSHDLDLIKKTDAPLKVAIIGTGYVGLVSGAGIAELGHNVTCVDNDQIKVDKLNQQIMPIYEPGIGELVARNCDAHRLIFSSDVDSAIREADVVITAVGTPMDENGEANLTALMSVVQLIGKNLNGYKVICTKSTVPIGTNKRIKALLRDMVGVNAQFDIVSNPEFLREGCALQDFFKINPIVLGSDSDNALAIMENLYQPLIETGITLIKTDLASAETIKYAWNCYSSIKVAYVNQLSHLCNVAGANIATVVKGVGFSEKLLPIHTVKPGPGFGGSCLPKDTAALVAMSKTLGVDVSLVKAARQANETHKEKIFQEFLQLLGNSVENKKIAVLGLSFKANTDDIRYSPAIDMIKKLLEAGAHVYAYDPQAMEHMKELIPNAHYCISIDEALMAADAMILLTEWDEFKHLELSHVAAIMAHKVIMDTRNIWNPKELQDLQFVYKNLGCTVF
jgi:UDPglucose 6-dehydrogenase